MTQDNTSDATTDNTPDQPAAPAEGTVTDTPTTVTDTSTSTTTTDPATTAGADVSTVTTPTTPETTTTTEPEIATATTVAPVDEVTSTTTTAADTSTADTSTVTTSTGSDTVSTPAADATPTDAPAAPNLPSIKPVDPIVVPAVEAKTYDTLWMTGCQIAAPDPKQPVQAAFEFAPLDRVAGEISADPNLRVRFGLPDLFVEAAKYLVVGNALGTFLGAVALLYPAKHLEAMVADATKTLEDLQTNAKNAQSLIDAHKRLPDSNAAKKWGILQGQDMLKNANDQSVAVQTTLDDLTPKLAKAQAALMPVVTTATDA